MRFPTPILCVQAQNARAGGFTVEALADGFEKRFEVARRIAVTKENRRVKILGRSGFVHDLGEIGGKLLVLGYSRCDILARATGFEDGSWHEGGAIPSVVVRKPRSKFPEMLSATTIVEPARIFP